MLFIPENHEPLREERWDEARARAAIARIVADTEAGIDPEGLWPAHPRDEWEGRSRPRRSTSERRASSGRSTHYDATAPPRSGSIFPA